MANVTLTPAVRDVLERSTITNNKLVLPEQLPRDLYVAVAKVIENCGGKWNRSAQGHLFNGDPRVKLGLALETGVAVDDKQKFQAFYTPKELADEIVQLANVRDFMVLEPSAGEGALAEACMRAGAKCVRCFDINPEAVRVLKDKGFVANTADFLTKKAFTGFHRIVMNPPFTRGSDIKHVAHAVKWLAPGGRLVSVMIGNMERPKLAEALNGHDWELRELPPGSFKESGTNVNTAVLIVNAAQP